MADQKKWFKVWGSILVDPSLSRLSLADMGRWVRLGAYMTTSGERGKLIIIAPAPMLLLAMEVESLMDAKMALKRLPNVSINDLNNDNGDFVVIMRNWFKYQVDSTAYERVKRSRRKKRVEEKRSLTSTSTSTPRAPRSPLERGGTSRETAVKGFEEAANNELCGPPKNMWAEVEKKI